MRIDESRARGLQAMYRAGATGALAALYEECTVIAYRIARTYRIMPHHLAVGLAQDAAADLLSKFLDDPDYHVKAFARRLYWIVADLLGIGRIPQQRRFESAMAILDRPDEISASSDDDEIDRDVLLSVADSDPWGRKAVADLVRSRSYRQAIRRIAVYMSRHWIYDHAEALHEIFVAFHPKTSSGYVSRRGLVEVRRRLLQGQRDLRKQAVGGSDSVADGGGG